jgi:hypothetical protein
MAYVHDKIYDEMVSGLVKVRADLRAELADRTKADQHFRHMLGTEPNQDPQDDYGVVDLAKHYLGEKLDIFPIRIKD